MPYPLRNDSLTISLILHYACHSRIHFTPRSGYISDTAYFPPFVCRFLSAQLVKTGLSAVDDEYSIMSYSLSIFLDTLGTPPFVLVLVLYT